jgi:hypothetical protein
VVVAFKTADKHLPRFPTVKELADTRDPRVRIGSPNFQVTEKVPVPYGTVEPVPVEYYINRYNEVLAGGVVTYLTVDDFLIGFCFELVLADLYACRNCDNNTASFHNCRTTRGNGFYYEFDRARYKTMCEARTKDAEAPRPLPRFVMRQCPGQKERVEALKAFYRGVTYR